MASVNISIRKEVYDFLNSIKKRNQSFSDVIIEFKGKKENKSGKSLLKYAGELKNVDWQEREKNLKEFKNIFNKKIMELIK